MSGRRKISASRDEEVEISALCGISIHRNLLAAVHHLTIWPTFFGYLANFCDETECFVELSQS
jgi:hypothetical protein